MRSTGLSDPQVIDVINEFFVATTLNVTTDGFPTDIIPALSHLKRAFDTSWRNSFGFASCFALDPDGVWILGSSVTAKTAAERLDPTQFHSAAHHLEFLVSSMERWRRLEEVQALPALLRISPSAQLMAEIMAEFARTAAIAGQFQRSMLLQERAFGGSAASGR